MTSQYYDEIIDAIKSGKIQTKDEIHKMKIVLCRKYPMDSIPSDADILAHVDEEDYELLVPFLMIKPVRTISGVAVVAVMTSPHDCPHGKCIFCPGGVDNGTAQSYTGKEPAALRAAHNEFDPVRQVTSRLNQIRAIGHKTGKVDLIIMGGTFTARDVEYQECFVKGCFDGMNNIVSSSIEEAHLLNQSADTRCIGMTVETRPDHFMEPHIDISLRLGATRVELGVQTLNDKTLLDVKRGHDVAQTTKATQLTRDAGMKVGYHMMPGLPGETAASDLETFKKLFSDSRFMPDILKIYPVLVIDGTDLHKMWKAGDYKTYEMDELVGLLADIKEILPPWTRIQRIQRDIPVQLIEAGSQKSHVRMMAQDELKRRGSKCRCIRCREAGHNQLRGIDIGEVSLTHRQYEAAGGIEHFISYEDKVKDIVLAFTRLRIPSENAHRPELENASIIRELRVLGRSVPIGEKKDEAWQHMGYGERLIEEAKEISNQQGIEKLLVMSGVGVREYYRKLEFERDGPYMGIGL